VDWGGCRCQALRLTSDPAATDPVCRFSPHHDRVVSVRESAQTDEFVYRTMKRPRGSDPGAPPPIRQTIF
jgi:pyrroloquinoline quinone biosynthesis protein E